MLDQSCPLGADTMRVLAANMVSVEGQTGATANTQAASNTQAKVGFATELSSRLVFKPSPTDPAQASVRGGAQGIGKPSEDWDHSRQAAGPSAGLQDVTAPPGSLPTTTSPKDNTPSTITLIEAAALHLSSTPAKITLKRQVTSPFGGRRRADAGCCELVANTPLPGSSQASGTAHIGRKRKIGFTQQCITSRIRFVLDPISRYAAFRHDSTTARSHNDDSGAASKRRFGNLEPHKQILKARRRGNTWADPQRTRRRGESTTTQRRRSQNRGLSIQELERSRLKPSHDRTSSIHRRRLQTRRGPTHPSN